MKRVLDKLLSKVRFDKRYVFFSAIIVLLGIIAGSLFIVILNTNDKNLVIEYVQAFIESIKSGNYNYVSTLINTLIVNYAFVILITIIGFTYFLSPLNILILFYKSFVIGFSLSSMILAYKIKGLLLSIVYIFPHQVINILLFAILTAFTLKISISMIKHIIKRKEVNMNLYFSKYVHTFIFIIILLVISVLYESFVAATLLKLLVNMF